MVLCPPGTTPNTFPGGFRESQLYQVLRALAELEESFDQWNLHPPKWPSQLCQTPSITSGALWWLPPWVSPTCPSETFAPPDMQVSAALALPRADPVAVGLTANGPQVWDEARPPWGTLARSTNRGWGLAAL